MQGRPQSPCGQELPFTTLYMDKQRGSPRAVSADKNRCLPHLHISGSVKSAKHARATAKPLRAGTAIHRTGHGSAERIAEGTAPGTRKHRNPRCRYPSDITKPLSSRKSRREQAPALRYRHLHKTGLVKFAKHARATAKPLPVTTLRRDKQRGQPRALPPTVEQNPFPVIIHVFSVSVKKIHTRAVEKRTEA